MKLQSLDDLFMNELQMLYDAEQKITKALPEMRDNAESEELKRAFDQHLRQTQQHVERLERIFQSCNQSPETMTSDGFKGLIDDGKSIIRAGTLVKSSVDERVRDAALIGAAQKVEHYEMAGYGCLITYGQLLGNTEAVSLGKQTLEEEKETDRKLTQIAERLVNPRAAQAGRKAA